ncbi:MAG: hypothetical protein ACI3ZY_05580 [Parabacteroides sp.]
MKSDKSLYVAVPTGTNRFATLGGYNFAHGGATLQELLIPVIHTTPIREGKINKVGVVILNSSLEMVSSLLKFKLVQREAISTSLKQRVILCGIYEGDTLVSNTMEITLDSTDHSVGFTRFYEVALNLNKPVRGHLLTLRVWDKEDELYPLIVESVRNNTLIDRDF